MNEVVLRFFDTGLIDEGVNDAVLTAIFVGSILAPLFFLGNVVWNFATTTIKNVGERPQLFNRMELIRACILWFILSVGYVPIFGTFARIGEALGRYSISDSKAIVDGKKAITDQYNNELTKEAEQSPDEPTEEAKTPDEKISPDESISAWDIVRGGINTFVLTMSGAIWGLLSVIIRSVVLMFAIIMAKLFYVIGPVVLAFSILPIFKDKLNQWVGVYLNCLCIPLTMNLLDTIIFSVVGKAYSGDSLADPAAITMFGIVMTICYALSFWVTSFYCGSSGAAKVMSTAVGAATTAVSMGVGKIASAAAAARSGGGIIENTASATNSAK
ncbi:MAG: type IV secretion system protein [Cyclobacteriaceae bacterium]